MHTEPTFVHSAWLFLTGILKRVTFWLGTVILGSKDIWNFLAAKAPSSWKLRSVDPDRWPEIAVWIGFAVLLLYAAVSTVHEIRRRAWEEQQNLRKQLLPSGTKTMAMRRVLERIAKQATTIVEVDDPITGLVARLWLVSVDGWLQEHLGSGVSQGIAGRLRALSLTREALPTAPYSTTRSAMNSVAEYVLKEVANGVTEESVRLGFDEQHAWQKNLEDFFALAVRTRIHDLEQSALHVLRTNTYDDGRRSRRASAMEFVRWAVRIDTIPPAMLAETGDAGKDLGQCQVLLNYLDQNFKPEWLSAAALRKTRTK